MKRSPLQLLQVFFRHVRIEVDAEHLPEDPPNPLVSIFVFDDINIRSQFGIAEVDPDHERGRTFVVTLRVIVDNKPNAEFTEQKFSPYQIDVEAQGVVVVEKGAEQMAPPEDLAAVNGASLIWASLREQVLSITSRMPAGAVILPTVHFRDLKGASGNEGTGKKQVLAAPDGPVAKGVTGRKASSKRKVSASNRTGTGRSAVR